MIARTSSRVLLSALALAVFASIGFAQQDPDNQLMDFESHLGAMRFFNANGRIKLTFKGTVLVRGFKGPLTVTSGLEKQYDAHGRVVYHGQGTLSLNGHWDSMQWFGQDMSGEWYGRGGFRLYGDYDKNLDTGWWWVDGDASRKLPWPTQSPNYILPYRRNAVRHPLTIHPKGG